MAAMKRLSLVVLVGLIVAGPARTLAENAAGGRVIRTIAVGVRPESVTRGFGGHHYVTVMGEPGPGDGVVKVIRGDRVEVFAEGMDEPKGIAFLGDRLVTADLKRVWQIDAQGRKSLLADESAFPKPVSYLNDVAAAPDGQSVYVTDMGARDKMMDPAGRLWPLGSAEARSLPVLGRVYQITRDGKVRLVVQGTRAMACPNGVAAPAKGELLIAEFFYGNLLRWQGPQLRILSSGFRGADGIEQGRDGRIYVSSWTQGKLWRLAPDGSSPEVLIEGLRSAADFCLDEEAGELWLPDMKAGQVLVLRLP
ncbi:MAG: gluconolaconase [Verrucomicrobia bacterium]|nr:MAG: gluconolaconase [Verrucomicrobiota bacterium]